MQAVYGYYNRGVFTPDIEIPLYEGRAMVVFVEDAAIEAPRRRMSREEALKIIDKYAGSIDRDFDPKMERLAYLDEKYGSIN
ncbi:MAG: hypothetical protein LBE35_04510 [Clostridiales bacterium]|jgi:hypothetical protein|nr:hypothetical protein [Clostridiales bacterium]